MLERLIAQDGDLELVGACATAIEAVQLLRGTRLDLLFLDVEMPGMTGLEMLAAIERAPAVVLVTGNREYAADAFEAGVTDYLVKPVSHARFLKAVQRVRARRGDGHRARDRWIFVRKDRALVRLDLADIRRIEADRDFVVIHTGTTRQRVAGSMEEMESRLPSDLFVRVHRSHIVRVDLIADFEDNSVVIGKDVVPVGRSYRGPLLARIRGR